MGTDARTPTLGWAGLWAGLGTEARTLDWVVRDPFADGLSNRDCFCSCVVTCLSTAAVLASALAVALRLTVGDDTIFPFADRVGSWGNVRSVLDELPKPCVGDLPTEEFPLCGRDPFADGLSRCDNFCSGCLSTAAVLSRFGVDDDETILLFTNRVVSWDGLSTWPPDPFADGLCSPRTLR